MKPDLRQRLTQSRRDGDVARRRARRRSTSSTARAASSRENFACPEHGVSLPELEPRIFSFNSPHGACPRCTGLGAQLEIDPDLLVPDPSRLDRGGRARAVVGRRARASTSRVIQAIADRYEIDLDTPWRELDRGAAGPVPATARTATGSSSQYRNRMGRKRQYTMAFEGLVRNLQRRYRETDSAQQRERIEEYMSLPAVPGLPAARGSSPRCSRSRSASSSIHEFTQLSVDGRARASSTSSS